MRKSIDTNFIFPNCENDLIHLQPFIPIRGVHRQEGEEGEDEYGGGDSNDDKFHCNQDYGQDKVINLANFKSHHYSDTRMLSDKLLFVSDTNVTTEELPSGTNHNVMSSNDQHRTYTGMLKLILGTLSYKAFSALYEDLDTDASQPGETSNVMPTLSGVASSVAKLDGTQMDEKQCIAYEIICCTFLLGLVYEGRDDDSKLRKCLQQTLANEDPNSEMETLVKELKIRGGQDQLLMFLTGPAGAGKSTSVMIARQFCFECCRVMGVLWIVSTSL